MQVDDCFELGYITKTKGLRGELQAFLDVDDPTYYSGIDAILIGQEQDLVPFTIEHLTIQGNHAVLKLEGIDHIDKASALKSNKLYLPLTALPKLEEDEFFFHDLINFRIIDQEKGAIGTVASIYNLPNNDLIAIDHKGHEVLVPIHGDLIQQVDKKNQEILVKLPDGLLDIYLES